MLVLSRKVGEKIVIEPGIELTVVDIRGGKVRLGIAAPKDISIRRSELEDRTGDEPRRQEVSPQPVNTKLVVPLVGKSSRITTT